MAVILELLKLVYTVYQTVMFQNSKSLKPKPKVLSFHMSNNIQDFRITDKHGSLYDHNILTVQHLTLPQVVLLTKQDVLR
jgi:hypothetical protein